MNPAGQQESFRRKAFLSTFYPETVSKLLFSVQKKYPFRVKKKKKSNTVSNIVPSRRIPLVPLGLEQFVAFL